MYCWQTTSVPCLATNFWMRSFGGDFRGWTWMNQGEQIPAWRNPMLNKWCGEWCRNFPAKKGVHGVCERSVCESRGFDATLNLLLGNSPGDPPRWWCRLCHAMDFKRVCPIMRWKECKDFSWRVFKIAWLISVIDHQFMYRQFTTTVWPHWFHDPKMSMKATWKIHDVFGHE